MTEGSLWFGEACMGLGTLVFTLLSLRARAEDRHHYLTTLSITLIATASYFAMAIGQTHVLLSDGHDVLVARYVDWAITTPLLLLGTASFGMRSFSVDKTIVSAAIIADVFMIATGLAAALSVDAFRWGWYAFSCAGFLAVLALLWGPIAAESAAQGRAKDYRLLSLVLTVLWVQYPVVWLLGPEGTRIMPTAAETVWYTVLDVLAKVAFGALTLAAVARNTPAIERAAELVSVRDGRRVAPAEK